MAVLVTGGAGYIGSHMVYALADAGEEVVVLDNLTTGFWWAIAPQAKLVEGDIGDEALVAELAKDHKFDAIIHFAGSIVVPESVADPLSYYLNNTVKTRSLIAAAVKAGIPRFVFSSTAAVYGNPERVPVEENAVLAPISPYGSSKLMSEWMLRDAAIAHPLKFTALRYFNVAGADPMGRTGQSTPGATHLIKVASETALGKRPYMQIFGSDYPTPDGTCVRDYIHVGDLVAAHRLALQRLRAGGDSMVANCGYGHGYSVLEVMDAVRRAYGGEFDVRMTGRRAGDTASVVANSTLARSELGWVPKLDDLDTIVGHALNWERILARKNSSRA